MKTFSVKNILIPIDFSETGNLALDHGAHMAKLFNARLIICHVMADYSHIFDIPEPIMPAPDINNYERGVASRLEQMSDNVAVKYGIKAETFSTSGRVATEIVNYAKEQKVDLIIMGTHGAHGWEEFFIGSNAHKVVTRSECPVLTVQTHATTLGFKNIILPIDNSRHSRQKTDHAIILAEKFGSVIHVLGLVESDEKVDSDKFNIKLNSVKEAIENKGIKNTITVVKGKNLASETLKFAKQVNGDLILIMTEHESDITGIFLGPVAKQIVNHSRIPVFSIRPNEGRYEGVNLSGSSNPMAS